MYQVTSGIVALLGVLGLTLGVVGGIRVIRNPHGILQRSSLAEQGHGRFREGLAGSGAS